MTNTKHRLEELCYQATRNTSFSPEERGKSLLETFIENEKIIKDKKGNVEKHEKLFIAWMSAKSRCISSMITGPANFPVARAQKANASEHKRCEEYFNYIKKVEEVFDKKEYYKKHPEARPIKTDDTDAKQRLLNKIVKLKTKHENMKKANTLIKKGDIQGLTRLFDEEVISEILNPMQGYKKGFESFELSNNLANIKRLEGRLKVLDRIESTSVDNDTTRYTIDIQNKRIYFTFDGKPSSDIITLLKSKAFKWTPSKMHWGRMLTTNAIIAAKQVESHLNKNTREVK